MSDSRHSQSEKPEASSFLAGLVRRHRFVFNVLVHNLLFAIALMGAYLIWDEASTLRTNPDRAPWLMRYAWQLPFFLIGKSLIFGWLKLFRGWWQYASTRDVVKILIASWLFLLCAYAAVLLFVWLPVWFGRIPPFQHSDGVLVLDFLLTVFLVCGARLATRVYREEMRPVSQEGLRRVLVVGAGNAAENLLREIFRMEVERYRVVGLVDDDPSKHGVHIHGVPVLGGTDELPRICQEKAVDEILIAVPSATQKELRRIIETCQGTKLQFQTLPSMDDLIGGRVTVSQIRKVRIEDLLGREAVQLSSDAIGRFLNNRRVLITGAGGSIGSEMCRQVCVFGPARLILIEQAENALFNITNELRRSHPHITVVPVICDIYDRARVFDIFNDEKPEVVIHAAAHKHVPLMEANPCEAIKNNIFGSKNIADASCEAGVAEFVQISTDKAVNPSSIMGCSKRVAEIYTQRLNGREGCPTQFKSVRFGNVLGSSGSVVPVFERQIQQGGPVTVTHPEMTRYFMTIPEASQLVLQAAATGHGGQIFLLDMGEPVKIVELARDMITLSGLRVGEDIDIAFTGVRPGEKLFEELRTEGEDIEPTVHPKVKVWKQRHAEWDAIRACLDQLGQLVTCHDREPIIRSLQVLVPEYEPLNPPQPSARPAGEGATEKV
jgi:FlaA1/EpsC-like NDP-sugar epimerase